MKQYHAPFTYALLPAAPAGPFSVRRGGALFSGFFPHAARRQFFFSFPPSFSACLTAAQSRRILFFPRRLSFVSCRPCP